MNGSCQRRVLMVDDEPNVLSAFRRALGRRFDVVTAESGGSGLQQIQTNGPFPVVVTDMRMPSMNGLEFLKRAHDVSRESVYIMLTGNADQETAVRAINDGRIFRFLTKPCSQTDLEAALNAGFRQYELITSERVLLRETLTGSIRIILEALTQSRPTLGAVAQSVRSRTQAIATELGVESDWRLQLAGTMCLLGFLAHSGTRPDAWKSSAELESCAASGGRLLRHIPRLDGVAAMISRQREEGMLPGRIDMDDAETRVVVGARLLRFAVDLEREIARCGDLMHALKRLRGDAEHYDIRLLEAAERAFVAGGAAESEGESGANEASQMIMVQERVNTRALRQGMVIDQDVVTTDSSVLLTRGRELTLVLIERLRGFARAKLIPDELNVLIPVGGGEPGAPDDASPKSAGQRGWTVRSNQSTVKGERS